MAPSTPAPNPVRPDRKSTRLNSTHTDIYTLSLHDALPILMRRKGFADRVQRAGADITEHDPYGTEHTRSQPGAPRSEEHTSELHSHRYLHSFPTRRSSDLNEAQRLRGSCTAGWCRYHRTRSLWHRAHPLPTRCA